MLRILAWLALAAYLIVVGLWQPALTPVSLAFAGLGAVVAAIPGPALALAAAIAWLKHRPAAVTAPTPTA
jgi:hypothetical protein